MLEVRRGVKQLDGTGMKRLHREWRRRTDGRVALVLDDVQGPFNVGAIIRTAAALRVDDVWLAGHTPDPDDAKVGKTALGTQRYLTFHRADTTIAAIDAARAAGYRVVGLELADGAAPAARAGAGRRDVPRRRPRGPRAAARPRWRPATTVAFLPLLGKVGSLNVATAASIALYELRRQALGRPIRLTTPTAPATPQT